MKASLNLAPGVFFGGNLEEGTFHVIATASGSPGDPVAETAGVTGVACIPQPESVENTGRTLPPVNDHRDASADDEPVDLRCLFH